MPGSTSPVEAFLADFHDARPGLTAKAFGALPVVFRGREFRSSYEILSEAVPKTGAPLRVLDLACGDGYLLSLLAARAQPGLALSGVDMSAGEFDAARARLGSTADLRRARAQALPFDSTSFDRVLCHLALMLMDDAAQVLREVRRVMKPGAAFAAIIGAPPPPSAAFKIMVEVLARHPPREACAEVRFGDRRFRDPDGIREILSPELRSVVVEEIHISRRLTPGELWDWFLATYDLHLRSESARCSIEREYLAAVAPHCGQDGRLEHLQTLRYVGAVA